MAGEKRRAASIAGDAGGEPHEHGPDCAAGAGAGAGDTCAHKQHSEQRHGEQNSAFDPNALISARGLVVTRNGRELLFDIDIDIAPREIVTIIGPNGAGKTTLVRVLLGLEKPDRGRVHRRKDLRIGYVPQRFEVDPVIPMTVERFLLLGGEANPADIADILREVNAPHTRSQQLSQLSGGELQRVLLARALLRRPDLLVLDEPVQGVDYAGEAELYNLIARLRDERGFGVLLISHDLHIVMARSDRVICLNRHVCCSGVPEIVAQHPAYVRLFGTQEARALAVYRHHHDHSHDIAGQPQPPETVPGENEGA